ncbi:MAG: HPr family phosphocarrier protein [Parvularcula sp.]|nr:HPr family phosphocarrier protein [Parvularcula sp.]
MTSSAERRVRIVNTRGLHARAAAKICETAGSYTSKITIAKQGQSVGARSLMALLMLGAGKGTDILVRAEGADAEGAVGAIVSLVEAGFHETD